MTKQARRRQLHRRILIFVILVAACLAGVIAVSRSRKETVTDAADPAKTASGISSEASSDSSAAAEISSEASSDSTGTAEISSVESIDAPGDTSAAVQSEKPEVAPPGAKQDDSVAAAGEADKEGTGQTSASAADGDAAATGETDKDDSAVPSAGSTEPEVSEEEALKQRLAAMSLEELAQYLRSEAVPEDLVYFMEEYPESREFVTDWLFRPDTPPDRDISGEVKKGTIPHFLQWDERWGYEEYGGTFIAVSGCGPTALSAVYSGLTGKTDMDPYVMANWASEMGYHILGSGTAWDMMLSGAYKIGLGAWEVDMSEASVLGTLRSGYPIICAMAPGDFTYFGHFIVLSGVDENGNISVRDSNSKIRTDRTWTYDELIWQTNAMWAYSYEG